MLKIFVITLVFIVSNAHAGWVIDASTGCKVHVEYSQPNEISSWSGSCLDGLAEGAGTLTSSNGTFLKGEFRKGHPLNAKGRELLILKIGMRLIVGSEYANGKGLQASLPHTRSDQRARPANSTSMVGKWAWVSSEVNCPEVHQYLADGRKILSNGDERIESAYTVFEIFGEPTFYKVLHTKLQHDGKSSCVADTDPVGRSYYQYIQFEGQDKFHTCTSFEKNSCFGTATRLAK